jgi:hypothetical protein
MINIIEEHIYKKIIISKLLKIKYMKIWSRIRHSKMYIKKIIISKNKIYEKYGVESDIGNEWINIIEEHIYNKIIISKLSRIKL